jgi:hypothetical protein
LLSFKGFISICPCCLSTALWINLIRANQMSP